MKKIQIIGPLLLAARHLKNVNWETEKDNTIWQYKKYIYFCTNNVIQKEPLSKNLTYISILCSVHLENTLPLTKRLSEMVSIQGWLPLKIKRSRLSFLAAATLPHYPEYMMLRGGWRSYRFVPCTGTGIGLKGMVRPSVGGLCTWGGSPFLKVQGSVDDTISIWKHREKQNVGEQHWFNRVFNYTNVTISRNFKSKELFLAN